MTEAQITSISTALTTCVGQVLDVFIDLLPIIGLTVAVTFGISFVMGRFKEIKRQKGR